MRTGGKPVGKASITVGAIREDFAGQRQLRFRLRGETLHVFKAKGESTHQVYLKALAYAFYSYGDRTDLQIDPDVDGKHKPCVAGVDMTGRVNLWVHCGPVSIDTVTYLLKHSHAKTVVLVEEHQPAPLERPEDFATLDFSDRVNRLRKQVHYRYANDKLQLLVFRPLDEWFDPDDVELGLDNYHLIKF